MEVYICFILLHGNAKVHTLGVLLDMVCDQVAQFLTQTRVEQDLEVRFEF